MSSCPNCETKIPLILRLRMVRKWTKCPGCGEKIKLSKRTYLFLTAVVSFVIIPILMLTVGSLVVSALLILFALILIEVLTAILSPIHWDPP